MAYADDVFIKMCKDILENGQDTKGEKVRPHWEDGTAAYTVRISDPDTQKDRPEIRNG